MLFCGLWGILIKTEVMINGEKMKEIRESDIHLDEMKLSEFRSIMSAYSEDEILLVFNYSENETNEVVDAEYALTIPAKEYASLLKILVVIGKKYEEETGRQIGIGKKNDKSKN